MNGPLPSSDGSGRNTDGTRIVVPLWRAPLAGDDGRAASRPATQSDRQGFRASR